MPVFTFRKSLIVCVEEIDLFHYFRNLVNSLILNALVIHFSDPMFYKPLCNIKEDVTTTNQTKKMLK